MEFPVEGNYTPNFIESECSISIPGIAWNEESLRSFKETPRITSPIKDSRDAHVQAFSAKRTSDTPRPTEELPSVESIIERVCSQMCNDLRRSGVLKDEFVDTVAIRVYKELSSRCFRRSTDQDGSASASPVSGRSTANNGSRVGQNNGDKSFIGDRVSVVSRESTDRSVFKLANSLNIRKEESRNSSKNNRVRSSASNKSRIQQNDGRSPADGDRHSVVSAASSERSVVKSANSINKRKEKSSQENRNSSECRSVSSRAKSGRSEIGSTLRSSSLVSGDLTRSGTPARGQRGSSANSVSSRGSVLESSVNKDTRSPSIRQTSSPSIQSIQSTPRSTEGRPSGNVQDRPNSIQSGLKRNNKTVLLDQSKPQNYESSTKIGKERASSRSSASHIPVRTRTPRVKGDTQFTRDEDKIKQASSPVIYRIMNSPNGHFGDEVDNCKRKSNNEIKRDDRKMCCSSQVSSTTSSVGLGAPSSNEDANKEKRIDETKNKSQKLASETSSSSQISKRVPSGRSSKIPLRSITPKVTEPANDKAMDNVKRIYKEKCEARARIENKVPNGIAIKAQKRASSHKAKEMEEENTQMNALERRKAYEAKRKLERKGALTAKSTKKTEIATKKKINKIRDKDELKNIAQKEPIVSTEVQITEKIPCHNEDNFMYEDNFEPMDEEETNEHHKSAADNGIVNKAVPLAPVSKIEIVFSNHDVNQAVSATHASERNPNNIPHLNFMADKEIHARHVNMVHERVAADSGRANPSSKRAEVDSNYLRHPTASNVLVQSQPGYDQGYCLTHMHPSIAHVYDNVDLIPTYKKVKEKNRRKAGKIFSYSDENEHVRRKPFNAKKKTTVGYVPGYGAVRVMKEDSGQACPGGIKRISNNTGTSFPVIENHPNHGRTQRPIVGYVPGYGPVRGPPVQVFSEVPLERVVLPPLDFGQAFNSNGNVNKRNKKGRGKKGSEDLLENRARAKPFNTYVDEEASRRFELQYTR